MTTPIFDALRRRNAHDLTLALKKHLVDASSSPPPAALENTTPAAAAADEAATPSNKFPPFHLDRRAINLGNDVLGRSPLVRAVESGFLDLVRPVLDFYKQHSPPLPPPIPLTPTVARAKLHSYANSRRLPTVEVVSAAAAEKAEAEIEDAYRLHVESERQALAKICQIDNALLMAASYGNADLVELLILTCARLGGDVNVCDQTSKQSVLHSVCCRGLVKAVTLLIRQLCHLSPRDIHGRVPLHYAAAAFSPVDHRGIVVGNGITVLTDAEKKHEHDRLVRQQRRRRCKEADKIAYLLIVNRAPIDVIDNDGLTPFAIALANRNLDVAKTLLDHDCECDTHDRALGMTPLMQCVRSNYADGWKLLLTIKDSEIGENAPASSDEVTVHDESRVKVDVNAVNAKGVTALEFAVLAGNAVAVRRLLHCGADPARSVHPVTGDTLAMTCVRLGLYSCLKRLCQPLPVWRRKKVEVVVAVEEEAGEKPAEQVEEQVDGEAKPAQEEDAEKKEPEEQEEQQHAVAAAAEVPTTEPEKKDEEVHQQQQQPEKDDFDDDDDDDAPRQFAQVGSLTFDRPPTPPSESTASPLSPAAGAALRFEAHESGFNNSKFPWIKCSNVLATNAVGETALDLAKSHFDDEDNKIIVYLQKLQPLPKLAGHADNKKKKAHQKQQYANEFERKLIEAHRSQEELDKMAAAAEEEELDDEELAEFLEEKRRREAPPIVFSDDDEEEEVVFVEEEEEEHY